MDWLIVKNDLKSNKMINLTLLLFIMFSAVLAVLAVMTAVHTFTSISHLYKTAQPPHFLMMHKGDINENEIEQFMTANDDVTDFQIVKMINIYGENLSVIGNEDSYNLSDIQLDVSFVKQNEERDLLLNANHEKINLDKGEIGIPVLLKEMYGIEMGDRIIFNDQGLTKEFIVTEFVLDSMMNSTMASSTRILLSDADFDELSGKLGEFEYLIEVYLTDKNLASAFQTIYENAGLPQNGQAVTYTILFLLSALTDIATVFVMLLVSILLIVISFICLKYTMMATLEEEIHEIGTMKAIGLPFKDIRNLYLQKYRVLSLVGVALGYTAALLLSDVFTKHISETFGSRGLAPVAVVLSIVAAGIVFFLTTFYCKNLLRKIRKVTVVDSLVRGRGFSTDHGRAMDGLNRSRKLSVNWLMGTREVFYRFKNWIVVFVMLAITELMVLVPINLLNTFEAPEFITYMGSSLEDILIEVENGGNLEAGYLNVKKVLEQDLAVHSYDEFRRVRVQTKDLDNQWMNLHIDVGQFSGHGLQYLSGHAPSNEHEIALSVLNAEKMGKDAGDRITIYFNGSDQDFVISGIYQDVTSGGFTAKALTEFADVPTEKYTFSVKLHDEFAPIEKADEWSKIVGLGVTVNPMDEFINQTLGGVAEQLKKIVVAVAIIGAGLIVLITVLFLKLRLAKDFADIAILKAIGFSYQDIKIQYLIKMGTVSIAGIVTGMIAADWLGEPMVNGDLSLANIGVKKVDLITNPIVGYLMCPILLFLLTLLVTLFVLKGIKNINIFSAINR